MLAVNGDMMDILSHLGQHARERDPVRDAVVHTRDMRHPFAVAVDHVDVLKPAIPLLQGLNDSLPEPRRTLDKPLTDDVAAALGSANHSTELTTIRFVGRST